MKFSKVLGCAITVLFVAATLASLSLAQDETTAKVKVRWRMPTSFPTVLDNLHGGGVMLTERVSALTDGGFKITPYAAGELLPAFGVLEGIQTGSVEAGYSGGFYYLGKNPSLLFDTVVPFGMTPRQHYAWMMEGGGLEMMREVYAEFNTINIPCGNTGAQMGGWFRKPIDSVDDIKGLRIRAAGLTGAIYADLGAVPQQIPPTDLYPAMERGALDAVEFVGPYDDERLGFHKVAKYYYSPGVLEAGTSFSLMVNKDSYEALPSSYQAALQSACAEVNSRTLARYDDLNVKALRRIVNGGVELRAWNEDIMIAMKESADNVMGKMAEDSAQFAAIYKKWKDYRDSQLLWTSVNDTAAENFLIRNTK